MVGPDSSRHAVIYLGNPAVGGRGLYAGIAATLGQYLGCAGRIANGVNTVHCSYATPRGHALIGARLSLSTKQLDDQTRRAALGIPEDVVFRTKLQLAIDILAEAIAPGRRPGVLVGGRPGECEECHES